MRYAAVPVLYCTGYYSPAFCGVMQWCYIINPYIYIYILYHYTLLVYCTVQYP
jgi:hypothetical protein